MSEYADNVVVQFRYRETSEEQAARSEILSTALRQLDELSYHLRRFSPGPDWSAQRCMIDSTPFRMRLRRARNGLDELARIDPGSKPGSIRWTIKFNSVRSDAEQRLDEIDACLCQLRRPDASPVERARETKVFALNRSKFLRALEKARSLIDERFDSR